MLKHFKPGLWFILPSIALVVLVFFGSTARATPLPGWLAPAPLSLLKIGEVASVPFSVNGNVDCNQKDSSECVVSTLFGSSDQNNRTRLNNTSAYRTVINQISNLPRVIAVPHSSGIISYTTEPPYGLYLYFTKNFASSITPVTPFAGAELQYRINRPPDGRLADRNNNRLAADSSSISFSTDSKWMAVSQPNIAMLRVNLETYEALPFAPGFDYTIGVSPSPKTAITNDGRYAVVASKDFGRIAIYDLGTCPAVPATITGPVACQSRNLLSFMQSQISGYISSTRIRFIDNTTLSFYANYNTGSGNKIAKFILKAGDGNINQVEYLALGDSYISGEGAFNYLEGTDTTNNKCHLSTVSYPFLMGYTLDYNSYQSIACSGAKTNDILNRGLEYEGQTKNRIKRRELSDSQIYSYIEAFMPGKINQLDFVIQKLPKVVTVSIGGNDIGFSQILKKCMAPGTCYSFYEDRLELVRRINKTFPDLVVTYQEIKNATSPDSKIYAIGYPQLAKPGGDCALNVRLNASELEFSKLLISYINLVISGAASRAGVVYTDVETALTDHRLCETSSDNVAVNGLTAGNDFPNFLDGPIGNESYHPNQLGHRLLKQRVLAATQNLNQVMPSPNLTITAPSETGLEILGAPIASRPIYSAIYNQELVDNTILRETPVSITIDDPQYPLKPSSAFAVMLHSDPISLGSYATGPDGKLAFQFQIPASAPPGYHDLHLYGLNMAGELVDIYKTIYVGASNTDLDGDGIPNNIDDCSDSTNSGIDYDQDGIDDACDGFIDVAPSAPTLVVSKPPTSQSQTNTSPSKVASVAPDQDQSEPPYARVFSHLNFNENQSFEANDKVLASATEKVFPGKNDWGGALIKIGLAVGVGLIYCAAIVLKGR